MSEPTWNVDFVDADSEQAGSAIVRVSHGAIGLMIFVVDGGECEAFLTREASKKLRAALEAAERVATND
jgi:hypothetical protein